MEKRVLVTGGEGGVARECQKLFLCHGWQVIAPSKTELNVRSTSAIEAFIANCPPIDLLICNAGIISDNLIAKMDKHDWDDVIDVNLKGAFRCARAVSGQMLRRRKGHLIFISSHSAFKPPVGQANYAASKAGLVGMAKSLAAELGSRSVRVNVIVPGFLETGLTKDLSQNVIQKALNSHTMPVFNSPENTAKFIYFLHQTMLQTSGQVFHLDSRILP